jgi:Fic family protein
VPDRYWHWDELKYRAPPPEFTRETWWCALKFRRLGGMKRLPLKDGNGRPFQFSTPDAIVQQLHEIDLGAGGRIGRWDPAANPETRDPYLVRSLMEEAITSSQLEGAVTTREVAKEMLLSGRKPKDKSERMILNNYRTMNRIRDLKSHPLTPELVLELHRMVTADTLEKSDAAGRLRCADEVITVEDDHGVIMHLPPSAGSLAERMEAMCAFGNGEPDEPFVHPAIRAMILHFWLAYDHPFVDGNGRTARALFYWAMLRAEYWLFEYISISDILKRAPVKYYMAFLHSETDENDLTYFLIHQSEVIRKAIARLHDYIAGKSREITGCQRALRNWRHLNHRQQAIASHALRHPGASYTVEGHQHSHNTAYDTARKDLLALVDEGLLQVNKSGRKMVFYPVPGLADTVQSQSGNRG